jgi:hypothetical protein
VEEVMEETEAKRADVAAAAPAVLEIEHGNKGVGFGLDSEAVSLLLCHVFTGEFTSVNFMLLHDWFCSQPKREKHHH